MMVRFCVQGSPGILFQQVNKSAEMAERGDVGVTIDVTRVPTRESGMTPYEILLSESQERMLVVARKGHEEEVRAILR